MRHFMNCLIGLGAVLLYPALGGIIAGISDTIIGGPFDWMLFAIGPPLLALSLFALFLMMVGLDALGNLIRMKVSH